MGGVSLNDVAYSAHFSVPAKTGVESNSESTVAEEAAGGDDMTPETEPDSESKTAEGGDVTADAEFKSESKNEEEEATWRLTRSPIASPIWQMNVQVKRQCKQR